ncbi:TetR/AcrR family transcriptional regulator [Acidisoma sp. 7E03]
MGATERKARERAEREQRIIAAARGIAEREGWSAVTVRRLAEEIEYSQPVLYSHFANRDAIVTAVALQGFREITAVLRAAAETAPTEEEALAQVAAAYLAFAIDRAALYEAMFTLPTDLRFARGDTQPELRAAFAAMAAVVAPFCADPDLVTETFWAALHGFATLEGSGRIRPAARAARAALLVQAVTAGRSGHR